MRAACHEDSRRQHREFASWHADLRRARPRRRALSTKLGEPMRLPLFGWKSATPSEVRTDTRSAESGSVRSSPSAMAPDFVLARKQPTRPVIIDLDANPCARFRLGYQGRGGENDANRAGLEPLDSDLRRKAGELADQPTHKFPRLNQTASPYGYRDRSNLRLWRRGIYSRKDQNFYGAVSNFAQTRRPHCGC